MVFESGARGSGLLRPFFFFAFADLDGQVRESLRERHRAALRTRAEAQAVVEQRADVGAALGDVETVDVDVLVEARVRDGGSARPSSRTTRRDWA
jgi:hypothetical protein